MGRTRPKPGCKVWRRLREPQHRLYDSELSEYTVLVDRFATEETPKALVVLRDGEMEVSSFRIGDLLTRDEIDEQRARTSDPDWWMRGVLVDFSMDGRYVALTTPHARRVEIALESG